MNLVFKHISVFFILVFILVSQSCSSDRDSILESSVSPEAYLTLPLGQMLITDNVSGLKAEAGIYTKDLSSLFGDKFHALSLKKDENGKLLASLKINTAPGDYLLRIYLSNQSPEKLLWVGQWSVKVERGKFAKLGDVELKSENCESISLFSNDKYPLLSGNSAFCTDGIMNIELVCSSSSKLCDEDKLKTCKADGFGFEEEDCGTIKVDNGAYICFEEACNVSCDQGFEPSGTSCKKKEAEPVICGPEKKDCAKEEIPANSKAKCENDICGFSCISGFKLIAGKCIVDEQLSVGCGQDKKDCTKENIPANSDALCSDDKCSFVCRSGFKNISGKCEVDQSISSSCGLQKTDCSAQKIPENSIAICENDNCSFVCKTGFHSAIKLGEKVCLNDTNLSSCGSPDPVDCTKLFDQTDPRLSLTCQDGACSAQCKNGYEIKNGVCIESGSKTGLVNPCGKENLDCTKAAPANSENLTCLVDSKDSGSCNWDCKSGFHRSNTECIENTDPSSCGEQGADCGANTPQNASALCDGKNCSWVCNSGFHTEDNKSCKADIESCVIQNGTGQRQWDAQKLSFSDCQLKSCNEGFVEAGTKCNLKLDCEADEHAENGKCEKNIRACLVNNGEGEETWNPATSQYESCSPIKCDSGFHQEDLACVADTISCGLGEHEEAGKCVSDKRDCNVLNGSGDQSWDQGVSAWGNCKVNNCDKDFHLTANSCISDTISCLVSNGSGTKKWNESDQSFEDCQITCNQGFSLKKSSGDCLASTVACDVANGEGQQIWDEAQEKYVNCLATSCNDGFHVDAPTRLCISNKRSCNIDNGQGFEIWDSNSETFSSCQIDSCDTGFHEDGGKCVLDTLVSSCGALAQNCLLLAATGTKDISCDGTSCSVSCLDGYQLKSGSQTSCELKPPPDAVDSCGKESPEDCTTKSIPANSDPVCVKATLTCGWVCQTGFIEKNGLCLSELNACGLNKVDCESSNGNPDFVTGFFSVACNSGVCEYSCPASKHVENGICQNDQKVCDIKNLGSVVGLGVKKWDETSKTYGACEATSCNTGLHVENSTCENDTRSCLIANGSGVQTWNGNDYGNCNITSCNGGFIEDDSNGLCQPSELDCSSEIANGSGLKSFDPVSDSYGICRVTGCTDEALPDGFHLDLQTNQCLSNTASCDINDGVNLLIKTGDGQKVWNNGTGNFGSCKVISCNAGYHLPQDGEQRCISDENFSSCGPQAEDCNALDLIDKNDIIACDGSTCNKSCKDGYVLNNASGLCEAKSVSCCGPNCLDCNDPQVNALDENSVAICSNDLCGFDCKSNQFTKQAGACVDIKFACGDPVKDCTDNTADFYIQFNSSISCNQGICDYSCEAGKHKDIASKACVSNVQNCILPNGSGTKTWDENSNSFGPCEASSCNAGFHVESGNCESNNRNCALDNGTGQQVWDEQKNDFGDCSLVSCNQDFHTEDQKSCVSDIKACTTSDGSGNQTWNNVRGSFGDCILTSCSDPDKGLNLNTGSCLPVNTDTSCGSNFENCTNQAALKGPGFEGFCGLINGNRKCEYSCRVGFHNISGTCLNITLATRCGTRDDNCVSSAPAGIEPVCKSDGAGDYICDYSSCKENFIPNPDGTCSAKPDPKACGDGEHLNNSDLCVSDTDINSCGSSKAEAKDCQAGHDLSITQVSCNLNFKNCECSCNPGYHPVEEPTLACSQKCVLDTVNICGGKDCTTTERIPDNSSHSCDLGTCSYICDPGFHKELGECKSDKKSCDILNGLGEQTWNGSDYGECLVKSCLAGFHTEDSRSCVSNQRACVIANGTGEQSWDEDNNIWGTCFVTSCDNGFHPDLAENAMSCFIDTSVISCGTDLANAVDCTKKLFNSTCQVAACEIPAGKVFPECVYSFNESACHYEGVCVIKGNDQKRSYDERPCTACSCKEDICEQKHNSAINGTKDIKVCHEDALKTCNADGSAFILNNDCAPLGLCADAIFSDECVTVDGQQYCSNICVEEGQKLENINLVYSDYGEQLSIEWDPVNIPTKDASRTDISYLINAPNMSLGSATIVTTTSFNLKKHLIRSNFYTLSFKLRVDKKSLAAADPVTLTFADSPFPSYFQFLPNSTTCVDDQGNGNRICGELKTGSYGQDGNFYDRNNFSRFLDMEDGTVYDRALHGYWQKCSFGLSGDTCNQGAISNLSFSDAASSCDNLGENWRLPDVTELLSLVDMSKGAAEAKIMASVFPATVVSGYWTDSDHLGSDYAKYLDLKEQNIINVDFATYFAAISKDPSTIETNEINFSTGLNQSIARSAAAANLRPFRCFNSLKKSGTLFEWENLSENIVIEKRSGTRILRIPEEKSWSDARKYCTDISQSNALPAMVTKREWKLPSLKEATFLFDFVSWSEKVTLGNSRIAWTGTPDPLDNSRSIAFDFELGVFVSKDSATTAGDAYCISLALPNEELFNRPLGIGSLMEDPSKTCVNCANWSDLSTCNTGQAFCPLTNDAGYGQEENYPAFVVRSGAFKDLGDGRVIDLNTGYLWTSGIDKLNKSVAEAENYCASLGGENFGFIEGWRLPSLPELMFILNGKEKSNSNESLLDPVFSGQNNSKGYWVSGGKVIGKSVLTELVPGNEPQNTICIFGRPFKNSFSEPATGIVYDSRTNLSWEKAVGRASQKFANALSYCEGLVLNGYSDWRLPNLKELISLDDSDPSISFPADITGTFWSSSVMEKEAFEYSFSDKEISTSPVAGNTGDKKVRCVRRGYSN